VGSFDSAISRADYASWTPGSLGTITVIAGGDVRASGINSYVQGVDDSNFTLSLNGSLPVAATTTASNLQLGISTPTNTYAASVTYTYTPMAIPEPSAYAVLAGFAALGGTLYLRRRKQT
jgi:hypothetical protein